MLKIIIKAFNTHVKVNFSQKRPNMIRVLTGLQKIPNYLCKSNLCLLLACSWYNFEWFCHKFTEWQPWDAWGLKIHEKSRVWKFLFTVPLMQIFLALHSCCPSKLALDFFLITFPIFILYFSITQKCMYSLKTRDTMYVETMYLMCYIDRD